MAKTVGFIGLGTMGGPMVRNLLKHGHAVTVWARRRDAMTPLLAAGAAAGESASHVAATSDVVITMVTDTRAVEDVILGDGGIASGAQPGSLVIDHSTIDPAGARRIASELQRQDIEMLDAPVSGGGAAAEAGTLAIMAGGSKSAFDRAHPLLSCYAKSIVHIGPSGAGQVCKACNQLVVAATIEAVAEALLLAERSGVDAAKVREALLGGFAGSKILEVHGQRMLDRTFDPGFRIRLHRKDARIVEGAAAEAGSPIPSFAVVTEQLQKAVDAGDGDRDHSGLFSELEREAGG